MNLKKCVQSFLNSLGPLTRRYICDLSGVEICRTGYKQGNQFPAEGWEPYDGYTTLSGDDTHYWFRATFRTPAVKEGETLVLHTATSPWGAWNNGNSQGLLYLNGAMVCGLDANHTDCELEPETDYALHNYFHIAMFQGGSACYKMSLAAIADYIADSVAARAAKGWNFGVAIIPEGIVEFVPEFSVLIAEINELLAGEKADAFNNLPTWADKYAFIENGLTAESMAVFAILPQSIQQQLFLERDPHGNVQVSLIESEKLFSALVKDNLAARKKEGTYNGKFSALHHFLGYEGRCAFPSNFDADYCYSLGYNASMLIQYGYTGYLSKVSNLSKPAEEWVAGGMPITKMMNIERRHGADKPVIRKALVELEGAPFKYFAEHRATWAVETCFVYPGAIQYWGPSEVCDLTTRTLALEKA